MKYPITQADIDKATEKVRLRSQEKQQKPLNPKVSAKQKRTKVKIDRAVKVLQSIKRLPILPLDEAAKRLNNDAVYRKASKGCRFNDD